MRRSRPLGSKAFHASLVFAGAGALFALGALSGPTPSPPPDCPSCRAELRSWVVAGRGRHLYLEIDCPEPFDDFDGRVEYTSAALRGDYRRESDSGGLPRIGRMSRETHLRPFVGPPDNRLEAVYEISPEMAACLQRDRLFSAQYVLLGPNSSSGLRRVMEECGCPMPRGVLRSPGVLGEFPGVDMEPGDEVPADLWPSFGLPKGPDRP